jgi:hypothetical protein
MALLTPNSFGTVLREYSATQPREPGGKPEGGRFASVPAGSPQYLQPTVGGSASRRRGPPQHTVVYSEGYGVNKVNPWNEAVAKTVLGQEGGEAHLKEIALSMVRDVTGVNFTITLSTREISQYDRHGNAIPGSKRPVVSLKYVGDDGNPLSENDAEQPTRMTRYFMLDDAGKLVANHSSFEKNRSQPPGMGKDVLRSHMKTYEAMGVERIETFANIDTGAYAWAKYGFAASDVGAVGEELEQLAEGAHGRSVGEKDFETGYRTVGRTVGIGDSEVREMKRIARSPSPLKVWEFADMTVDGVKVGKALMTNGDFGWSAYLDLKSPSAVAVKQRERFWKYVGRTKGFNSAARRHRIAAAHEAMVIVLESPRPKREPGELCEWDGSRYTDRRIWADMLDGDTANFYELRDPSARAAYRGQLPSGRR